MYLFFLHGSVGSVIHKIVLAIETKHDILLSNHKRRFGRQYVYKL